MELSKLGYTNIDALDISQEMLDKSTKTKAYTKFICAPLNEKRNAEIATGEYHALITTGTLVIGHVRPQALDEMIRMVKIGKKILFMCQFIECRVSPVSFPAFTGYSGWLGDCTVYPYEPSVTSSRTLSRFP